MVAPPKPLPYTVTRYNSLILDSERLPSEPAKFEARLARALQRWQADGYRGAYLPLSHAQAPLIPVAIAHGFRFHVTDRDLLLLLHPLGTNGEQAPRATHTIGAGGVVFNNQNEVLVISEKARQDQSQPYYKLPGGYIEAGEHISAGVVREVHEETGIESRFEGVVGLRLWHIDYYGKSNLYVICRLSALTDAITPEPSEIDEALWMPVEAYLTHPHSHVFNREMVRLAAGSSGFDSGWFEGYERPRDKMEIFFQDE